MRKTVWAVTGFFVLTGFRWGTVDIGRKAAENQKTSLDAKSENGALSLLPTGQHLGYIAGFESFPPATEAAVRSAQTQAIAKGMRVARVQTDWSALEISPGVFNKTNLENQLSALRAANLKPFLTLTTADSDTFELPADLMDPSDSQKLKAGLTLDSPTVVARFNDLMDWVVPLLVSNGGWGLSIANEPGTLIDDGHLSAFEMANFARSARSHIQSLDSRLAVTVTMRYQEVLVSAAYLPSIIAACDVACFNYYPQDPNFYVESTSTVSGRVAALLQAADGKEMVIQEVGCPGGYEGVTPTNIGGSLSHQSAFFHEFVNQMAARPKLRAAFVFQMVDWSSGLTNGFLGGLPPAPWVEAVRETMRTLGLLRYEDGTSRPALAEFYAGVERFKN